MKKIDYFVVLIIGILVILLGCINLITEKAIAHESDQLSQHLNGVKADILDNMMSDYVLGLHLVDEITVDSDSHMAEATLKIMDYMMDQANGPEKEGILKTFSAGGILPLAIVDFATNRLEYIETDQHFLVMPDRLKKAAQELKTKSFVIYEDVYIKPNKAMGKQRTYFYKSRLDGRVFVSVVDFSKSSDFSKAVTQRDMNKTFEKLQRSTGSVILAANRNGIVQLTSDPKRIPSGTDLTLISGNEHLLQEFSNASSDRQSLKLFTSDLTFYPNGIDVKWFRVENLYVMASFDDGTAVVDNQKQFLVQRMLLFFSVIAIGLVIVLMRRNFMYYVETNELEVIAND